MTIRDRIRSLRAEAAMLERSAGEEEGERAYIAALHVERAGVEQALRFARALGAGRERLFAPDHPDGPYIDARLTGDETAVGLEARLENIAWELARVAK